MPEYLKIPELTPVVSLDGSELIPLTQNGSIKRATVAQVQAATLTQAIVTAVDTPGLTGARKLNAINPVSLTDQGAGNDLIVRIVDNPEFSGTSHMRIPAGTTSQRGDSTGGNIRYNSETNVFEGYLDDGSGWTTFEMSASALSVTVKNNGTTVGDRPALNFIPGSNVAFTIADDAGNEEIDITVALSATPTIITTDNLFTLQDDGDNTKQLQFQLSGITTGTTRTLTVPDVSDTLVTLDAAQTLTSKTLTAPTINGVVGGTATSQTITALTTTTINGVAAATAQYTTAEETKLSGIETGADVTDTANVTAAGALMDSELTDITAVKALDQGVATTDSPTFASVTAADFIGTDVQASGSAGVIIKNSGGAAVITAGGGVGTGVSFAGGITVSGTVDGRDVATDGAKLDTIETNADVTDTANVTAAGALMDSELTDIAAVKALDQGVATTDSPTFNALTITTNIAVTGTVDGRDVAADGTKLDGVETGADVTDTANVTAAGALMDSELTDIAAVKALDQGVATTDSPTFANITTNGIDDNAASTVLVLTADDHLNLNTSASADIGTLADGATITPDFDANQNFTVTLGGNRTLANPSNINVGQTGSIFVVQDGTGSRTLSYGSYWEFPGGTAPTLSTAAGTVDRIDYIVRTATSIHAVASLDVQ